MCSPSPCEFTGAMANTNRGGSLALALSLSAPLPQWSLSLVGRGGGIDAPFRVEHSTISYSLPVDQL